MSDYSSRVESINEKAIMANYGLGGLEGDCSIIDNLFVAWELTREYASIPRPECLTRAENDTTDIFMKAFGEGGELDAEDSLTSIGAAAIHHGFALGLQFALAAMKNDGAVWVLATRPDAATGQESGL